MTISIRLNEEDAKLIKSYAKLNKTKIESLIGEKKFLTFFAYLCFLIDKKYPISSLEICWDNQKNL